MNLKQSALLFSTSILIHLAANAQDKPIKKPVDSIKKLNEVVIRPYFSLQPLLRSTGSIGLIDQQTLNLQPSSSMVSAMNTVPGVRMEERSPGSYRLSIRGSLLRSPFGVRNVKIYFDDFPLTDAGGNSYLNALDVAGAAQLQVLKGPHSSIFGANSGGVVLINPQSTLSDFSKVALKLEGGSYGAFREALNYNQQSEKYSLSLTQAYQRSDGYRDHSGMNRKYLQALQKYDYHPNASLKALLFYSDIHYNTPGGLNLTQYEGNPAASRSAAGPNKGASEQNAGIYSKTLYGGLSHTWTISPKVKHFIAVFGSYTDFKNPFISNYEKRKENTLGARTYVEYTSQVNTTQWKINAGLESMQTSTDVNNFDNNYGTPGAVQNIDDLKAKSNFAFAHLSVDLAKKLMAELSASANLYGYSYQAIAPNPGLKNSNDFGIQIMPRLALSYLFTDNFSWRASVSRGYSPPTLAEVRASDQQINISLMPESGWNYESGFRLQGLNDRVYLDINAFYYHLQQAIVRRVNASDAEYFINAGGTKQMGLETSLSAWIIPATSNGWLRGLQWRNAFTFSRFRFSGYSDGQTDYSGNNLTGVPASVLLNSTQFQFAKNISLFVQHNYTSKIPLNDANTTYAKYYHLLQAKAGKTFYIGYAPIEIYIGADNLLNQKYSLGNDLNAFGARYFNAAAPRNFYAGLAVRL